MMTLKEFLTQDKILQLIDYYNYDTIYRLCEVRLRHQLTDFLLNVIEIDPLTYMTSVPASYASELNSITSVTIPENIQQIGVSAFHNCLALKEVNIPESVTEISAGAFWKCRQLKSVNIPNQVTSISEMAFRNCTSLENIVIPNSVTTIGTRSFRSSGLKEIIIPEGVTDIGEEAFYFCIDVKTIHIPASVVHIGKNAFGTLDKLSKIFYTGTKEQWKCLYRPSYFTNSYFTVECIDGQLSKKYRPT